MGGIVAESKEPGPGWNVKATRRGTGGTTSVITSGQDIINQVVVEEPA